MHDEWLLEDSGRIVSGANTSDSSDDDFEDVDTVVSH